MSAKEHILIFEPEVHTRLALNISLRGTGRKVTIASDAKHAMTLLQGDQRFNMIIVDLCLPDMSGMMLVDYHKESLRNTPLLIITGFKEKRMIPNFAATETVKLIYKPFSDDEFLSMTETVLETRKNTLERSFPHAHERGFECKAAGFSG